MTSREAIASKKEDDLKNEARLQVRTEREQRQFQIFKIFLQEKIQGSMAISLFVKIGVSIIYSVSKVI